MDNIKASLLIDYRNSIGITPEQVVMARKTVVRLCPDPDPVLEMLGIAESSPAEPGPEPEPDLGPKYCKNGHLRTEENTGERNDRKRKQRYPICKTCSRIAQKKHRERRRKEREALNLPKKKRPIVASKPYDVKKNRTIADAVRALGTTWKAYRRTLGCGVTTAKEIVQAYEAGDTEVLEKYKREIEERMAECG